MQHSHGQRVADLTRALTETLTNGRLKQLLRRVRYDLPNEIPQYGSRFDYSSEAVDCLHRHGLIDLDFFHEWVRLVPDDCKRISKISELWGVRIDPLVVALAKRTFRVRRATRAGLESCLTIFAGISLVVLVAVLSRADPERSYLIAGSFILGPVLLYSIARKSQQTSLAALVGGIYVLRGRVGVQHHEAVRTGPALMGAGKPIVCAALISGACYALVGNDARTFEVKSSFAPAAPLEVAPELFPPASATAPPGMTVESRTVIDVPLTPKYQATPRSRSKKVKSEGSVEERIIADAQAEEFAGRLDRAAEKWEELCRKSPGWPDAQVYRVRLAKFYLDLEHAPDKALAACEGFRSYRRGTSDRDEEMSRLCERAGGTPL